MAFEKAVRETMLPMLGLTAQETNDIYFKLPAEDLANTWALDYIENHIEECWKFQQKCYKIMRHIFKKKSFPY